MAITELLDELRLAHLERGRDVDRHLKPGIPHAEVLERTAHLGLALPDDLLELYEWRDGQDEQQAEMDTDAFSFRDNVFADLDWALREYPVIQEYYAPEPDSIPYGFELTETFPFAHFMGSSYVVVCGAHTLDSPSPNPVAGIFQGVDMYFHSLETMLETCLEWMRHPDWDRESLLDDEIEREIWRRRNPGAFRRWDEGSV